MAFFAADSQVFSAPARGDRGTTLVEMMVSTALFGILSLGMADMFAENSRKMAHAQNESRLSEQISEFSQAIENYLGNTTQLISCNCAGGCIFDDTVASGAVPMPGDCMDKVTANQCGLQTTAAQGTPVLVFEYEDADNPAQAASNPNCVLGKLASAQVVTGTTPENLPLRGCKKRISLNYVEPAADTPGQLLLFVEDPVTGTVPAGATPLHSLSGVYQFRCGQLPGPGGKAFSDHFRLQLKMKARSNNLTASAASPYFEGWLPGSQNFTSGTHRNLTFDSNFHNLNVPGVQFGKTITSLNCTPTTADPLTGISNIGDCCSGYQDNQGKCLDVSNCTIKGAAPLGGLFSNCCSHKVFLGVCV